MLQVTAGPRRLRRVTDDWEDRPYEHLQLRPLSPTIGAEVAGVDLSQVSAAQAAEIDRALLEWKVLFFANQHITPAEHRDFAARWGELEVHPFLAQGAVPEIVRFEKGPDQQGYENVWHSDVTWRRIPPLGSVLHCVECPPVGGDTLWADMGAAYDGLPAVVRDRIDGLVAVHDFTRTFGRGLSKDKLEKARVEYPPVEHPVVRVHPATGRRTLFVNAPFTSHIVGLDPPESDRLLETLCAQAQVPEYQCRFRWAAGSVAFWDNRATQHYAASDYAPQRRVMERVTIIGDRPVGLPAPG